MNHPAHDFRTPLPGTAPFHLSDGWWDCWAKAFAGDALRTYRLGGGVLRMMTLHKRLGPLSFRSLQSATNLDTCYFDVPEGTTPEELEGLPDRLLRSSDAHKIRFDWLREESPLLAAAAQWRKRHMVTVDRYACTSVVDCRRPFEDYLARSGKSLKKYWRTCRRELIEGGGLSFELVTGGAGVDPLVREMLELEASGWKGEEGSAILNRPAETEFYTALARSAAEAGTLRLAALREDGRLIAFEYCIVSERIVLALKVGYAEDRSRLQPGHILALMNIRDACADPVLDWYDMLGNSLRVAEYKRKFATDTWYIYRVRVYSRSVRGLVLYALFRARPQLKKLRDSLRLSPRR